jgi:hypothetical protein
MTVPKIDKIPKAYDAYAKLFAQMDAPLLRIIGGVLRALPSRIDTGGDFQNQPLGDFVGYDGLENQGALSNLLETEWLLRELDANDFVRRVAEGEVLFRKRNFQDAGKRNTLAVILDCGPWMLGRNRLLGLAALFHLAIRAERMKADLIWIVPGSPDRGWRAGLTRKTVQRYLSQIVQAPLGHEQLSEVMSRLDVVGQLDCWYVGSYKTAHLAQHPNVTGAVILRQRHNASDKPSAKITVRHRNRTLAQVDVAFEDDPTCVAALRRPFAPEVSKTKAPTARSKDDTVLTTLPFQTGWQFDRHNLAAVIRMHEGVLWQPLMPANRGQGVWFPINAEDTLLGLHIDAKKCLSAMIATPSNPDKSGPQICHVTLVEVDLSRADSTPVILAHSLVTLDPAQYTGHPVGNLHPTPRLSLVRNDGVRGTFKIAEIKSFIGPQRSEQRVLLTDQTYRIQIGTDVEPRVEVVSNRRDEFMLRVTLLDAPAHLTKRPRHVLYNPHNKIVAISFDAHTYQIYGPGEPYERTIPDGLTLLQLIDASQALAWNSESAELVRLTFRPDKTMQKTITQYHGPAPGIPRHCALTGTTLALQSSEDGRPEFIVPIHAKKGRHKVTPLNITEAIENARTIWLSS